MTDFIKSYDTTVIYGGDEAILEPNVCIAYISRNPLVKHYFTEPIPTTRL